jgi:hypothetical protein
VRKLLLIATISLGTLAMTAAIPAAASYRADPAEGLYGQIHGRQVNQCVKQSGALAQAREASEASSNFSEFQPGAMASNAGQADAEPYQQVITSQAQLNAALANSF